MFALSKMNDPQSHPPGKKPPSAGLTIFVVLGLPILLMFIAVFWLLSIMMRG